MDVNLNNNLIKHFNKKFRFENRNVVLSNDDLLLLICEYFTDRAEYSLLNPLRHVGKFELHGVYPSLLLSLRVFYDVVFMSAQMEVVCICKRECYLSRVSLLKWSSVLGILWSACEPKLCESCLV